jgi:hypothetical protein
MPSLKTLRMRIASVKSTQKITSAMKMVAAAKLRRAQEQAEAARPYALRMGRMLGSLAGSMAAGAGAPKLLAGTGADKVHLLVVCTSDRGLCGGFNSSIVRLARAEIRKLLAEGKTVKILCVGRKGRDQLRRDFANLIVGSVDEVGRKRLSFADAQRVSDKVLAMFEAGEFDVAALYYARFKSAMTQFPTRAVRRRRDRRAGLRCQLRIRTRGRRDPRGVAAAQPRRPGLWRASRERRVRAGGPHVRDGQRHPQRRRHDQEAHAQLQPLAPGLDHQGTDRDHLRRRSSLISEEQAKWRTTRSAASSRSRVPSSTCASTASCRRS